MGDIGGRGQGKGRAGRGERLEEPKGRRGWGRQIRGEERGQRRGDERCEGSNKENDGRDDNNDGTGVQATELKGTQAGT